MSLTHSPTPVLDYTELFTRHGIHPKFQSGIKAMSAGIPPTPELKTRLKTVANYQECLDEILTRLSQPFAHLFTPKHESLEIGDLV